jgi:hypothetical protein
VQAAMRRLQPSNIKLKGLFLFFLWALPLHLYSVVCPIPALSQHSSTCRSGHSKHAEIGTQSHVCLLITQSVLLITQSLLPITLILIQPTL